MNQFTKEDLEAFMQTEEFSQLDELSRKTLANYIRKSADHARGHSFNAGQVSRDNDRESIEYFTREANKSAKRQRGINRAAKHLAKESYDENLTLLLKAIHENDASEVATIFGKLMEERIAQLAEEYKQEVSDSIFNESELNEISKKTLGNYMLRNREASLKLQKDKGENEHYKKSALDIDYGNDREASSHIDAVRRSLDKTGEKIKRKQLNRDIGAYRATNRLTKEDADSKPTSY